MSTTSRPQVTSMDGSEGTEARFHSQFNDPDADMYIMSSDSVVFKVHQKNVDIIMGAFSTETVHDTDTFVVAGVPVHLYKVPEPCNVMENVLQFLYRRKHTFPANLSFQLLMEIAEAAEKYEVSAAVMMCEKLICKQIPSKPMETLAYALKYNHTELVDEAALNCIILPLSKSITVIPATHVVTWIAYKEEWQDIFDKERWSGTGFCQKCSYGPSKDHLLNLQREASLTELRKRLIKKHWCAHHSGHNLDTLNERILESIERFPAFTAFQQKAVLKPTTLKDLLSSHRS